MQTIRRGPFKGLPRNHFHTIYADPPWAFAAGKSSRTAPYPTMKLADIMALPVADLAAPSCALFCWTSGPFLEWTFDLATAWGFKYVTKPFTWVKMWPRERNRLFVDWQEVADGAIERSAAKGTGYWTLSGSEDVLLFTRGDVDWAPGNPNSDRKRGVGQLDFSERREHSRKPESVQDKVEAISRGPYLELFARRGRPGWRVWGNQTDTFAPVSGAESSKRIGSSE